MTLATPVPAVEDSWDVAELDRLAAEHDARIAAEAAAEPLLFLGRSRFAEAVRGLREQGGVAKMPNGPRRFARPARPVRVAAPITEPQRAFLVRLLGEIGGFAAEDVAEYVASQTKTSASALIDDMLHRAPRVRVQRPAAPAAAPEASKPVSIPEGRYALPGSVTGSPEPVIFFRLDCPTEGRWSGWTFLAQVTGAVGERGVAVKGARKATVLAAIAADPDTARHLYGREIGRCGHCNRILTDDESRAAGIGPVCAAKGF